MPQILRDKDLFISLGEQATQTSLSAALVSAKHMMSGGGRSILIMTSDPVVAVATVLSVFEPQVFHRLWPVPL